MRDVRPRPWIVYGLVAANLAMFGFEVAGGVSPFAPTAAQLLALGGNLPSRTLHGEWWRLGSSMFLHAGVPHLVLNMVCLYQARLVERLFGRLAFAVLYLSAGLGGGIASMIVSDASRVSVGASGAVFGVYGALGAYLALRRANIQVDDWQRTVRSLAMFLGLNLIIGLSASNISVSAHVGGLLVGFAFGAVLLAGAGAQQQRTLRSLGLAAMAIALTAIALLTLSPAPEPAWLLALGRFEAVEHDAATSWNDAVLAGKRGDLPRTELADRLERTAVTPFQKALDEIAAAEPFPERLQTMLQRHEAYATARLAAWRTYLEALREPDPARRESLLETYQRREAEANERRAAYEAEIHRLKS